MPRCLLLPKRSASGLWLSATCHRRLKSFCGLGSPGIRCFAKEAKGSKQPKWLEESSRGYVYPPPRTTAIVVTSRQTPIDVLKLQASGDNQTIRAWSCCIPNLGLLETCAWLQRQRKKISGTKSGEEAQKDKSQLRSLWKSMKHQCNGCWLLVRGKQ